MTDFIEISKRFKDQIIPIHNNNKKTRHTRKSYHEQMIHINPMLQHYNHIFQNQKEFGKNIVDQFENLQTINVLAMAPTQSGKTGSMIAVIYEFLKRPLININMNHVVICTGLSSCDWRQQTRDRFPKWMHQSIFHRNDLHKAIQKIQHLNNILIIIDEAHIASKKNQSIHKLYLALKAYDKQHLYQKNIKFVQFTATPDNLQNEFLQLFGEHATKTVLMNVPKNYISAHSLYLKHRVSLAKNFVEDDDHEIHEILDNIHEFKMHVLQIPFHAYHIIRTPKGHKHDIVIKHFKRAFHDQNALFISEPYSNIDLKSILKRKPTRHTFIFIKDKLRCADTICHSFLGSVYDRFAKNKQKNTTLLQGLWGRCTGFHNNQVLRIWTNFNQTNNPNLFQ